MKKKLAYLLTAAAAMVLTTAGVFATKASAKDDITPAHAYTNGDASTYYNGISTTATGNTLLTALRTLNLNKRQSTVGYSSMGTSTSGQFKYTDYDPDYVKYDDNGQPYGTRISSFYTYTSATSWNREHVWPNSHGGGSKGSAGSPYPDADIHMPRPTISSENSSRGNSYFVEGMNHSSNGWDPYTAGYSEESRGEAARITFYCMTVNSKLSIAPNNTAPSGTDPITGNSYSSGTTMGNLVTLLKWNINYPVTQREKNRNEGAEYLQGNRNAFVDHPEYACRIWGSVNSSTQSLCNNAQWTEADKTAQTYAYENGTYTNATNEYTISAGGEATFGNFIDGNKVDAGTSWTLYNSDKSTVYSGSSYGVSQSNNNFKITTTSEEETFYLKSVYSYTDSNNTAKTAEFWLKIYVSSTTATGPGAPEGSGSMSNEDYILVTSNSQLSDGDKVVLTMDQSREEIYGITGWNNSSDATASNSNANWKQFVVESKSSTGFKLKDTSASSYIASPSGNEFKYSSSGGTVSAASDGKFVCNNRYLCKNGNNYRCYTSVQTNYVPFYIYKVNEAASKTLSSISVSTAPSKTSYSVGETFSPTGLVINRYFTDSTSDTYTYEGHTSEFSFSPNTATALAVSNTSVTITYGGKSTTQAITVSAVQKTLSSISLSGTQTTTFEVGANFTFGGTVTATYSDASTENVTSSCTYTGYNMSAAGEYTVTVTYTYGSVTKEAYYQITVADSGSSQAEVTITFIPGTDTGSTSVTKSGVTISMSTMNNASYYQIYGSSSGTFSVSSGTITKIEFSCTASGTSKYGPGNTSADVGSYDYSGSNGTWTGSSSTVTLSSTAQVRMTQIVVTVSGGSAEPLKELSSISISGYTTTFLQGDTFSFGGTVTALYDDATTADVTSSSTFSGYSMSVVGQQTVTVSYTEDEVTKTTTYQITISANAVSSLTISGSMSKTTYNVSGSWSAAGFTVVANYESGAHVDVTNNEGLIWSFSPSTPNSTSITSVTATATFGGKSVTSSAQSVSVKQTNPIEEIYSKAENASVDVYGYYVGFLDGTGPVIMDGAFGVVVYSKSADVSSYIVNETILHVTGSVKVYEGLYEISSPSISVASGSFTTPDTPVVYACQGDETQVFSSRLTTVSGVPSIPSDTTYGDFSSNAGANDILMNFTVGTRTVKVFYKKAAQTADTSAYAKLKTAVSNGTTITVKGFTGWYKNFQVQMNGLIEAETSYTAVEFAQYLLSETDKVCSYWTEGSNFHDALVPIWNKLSNPTDTTKKSYPFLPADQKAILVEAVANESGTVVQQAIARYEYLCGRYGLSQFIEGRSIIPVYGQLNPILSAFTETSLPLTITIIVGVVGVTALCGFIFIRKRKES